MKLIATTETQRLLECRKCREPAVSSAWSGRVIVHCDYCSFDDERELVLDRAVSADAPYRDKPLSEPRQTPLELNVGKAVPGLPVKDINLAMWRAELVRSAPDAKGSETIEFMRLWMGTWLSERLYREGDRLRARVVLETTLESLTIPPYRAILMGRLAQQAVGLDAIDLAKRWLSAAPELAISEVESETKAAYAFIALKEKNYREALTLTGNLRAGAGFSLGALGLATAINVEAHERDGDLAAANSIMRSLQRMPTSLTVVSLPAISYGLATKAFTRLRRATLRRQILANALVSGVITAVICLAHYMEAEDTVGIVLGGAAAAALVTLPPALSRPKTDRGVKIRQFLMTVVPVVVVLVVGGYVRRHAPSPARVPVAPMVADPEGRGARKE